MSPILIVMIVVGAVLLWAVGLYNGFVTLKARIKAAIQEIGNQLKRQVELIPNLESATKGYLKHEKDIFTLLADARKSVSAAVESGNLDALSSAGDKVSQLIPKLQVLVESNPQIEGSQVVAKLMEELRDTSDKVMYSRRTFVDLVADYNIKIATFPSSILANMFGFKPEEGLKMPNMSAATEVSQSDTVSPKINL